MKCGVQAHSVDMIAGAVLLAGVLTAAGNSRPVLNEVADVPLPGGATRFDYQSFDVVSDRAIGSHRFRG